MLENEGIGNVDRLKHYFEPYGKDRNGDRNWYHTYRKQEVQHWLAALCKGGSFKTCF